jgi:hypothetical protein
MAVVGASMGRPWGARRRGRGRGERRQGARCWGAREAGTSWGGAFGWLPAASLLLPCVRRNIHVRKKRRKKDRTKRKGRKRKEKTRKKYGNFFQT